MKVTQSVPGLLGWMGIMWLIMAAVSGVAVAADEPLAPPQQVIQKTADQLQVSLQKFP